MLPHASILRFDCAARSASSSTCPPSRERFANSGLAFARRAGALPGGCTRSSTPCCPALFSWWAAWRTGSPHCFMPVFALRSLLHLCSCVFLAHQPRPNFSSPLWAHRPRHLCGFFPSIRVRGACSCLFASRCWARCPSRASCGCSMRRALELRLGFNGAKKSHVTQVLAQRDFVHALTLALIRHVSVLPKTWRSFSSGNWGASSLQSKRGPYGPVNVCDCCCRCSQNRSVSNRSASVLLQLQRLRRTTLSSPAGHCGLRVA